MLHNRVGISLTKMADTYLFFIDDTGINGHDNFVLRGGFLIKIDDYINLYKNFNKLKEHYHLSSQEIKWNDLTRALYVKHKYPTQPFSSKKTYHYLYPFSIQQIKDLIINIFEIINKYNYVIITTIAHGKPKHKENFLYKAELQDLMQRAQKEMASRNANAILIYDSDNKEKEKGFKEAYTVIRKEDPFIKDYGNLIDTIFCENSSYATGVQYADFIVGTISGTLRNYTFSKHIYQKFLFNRLRRSSGFLFQRIMGFGLLAIPTKNESLNKDIRTLLIDPYR